MNDPYLAISADYEGRDVRFFRNIPVRLNRDSTIGECKKELKTINVALYKRAELINSLDGRLIWFVNSKGKWKLSKP